MSAPDKSVTRDDIEAKLREITGEVSEEVESTKNLAVAAGIGAVILIVIIGFLLGRRQGTRRTTIVEVRRI
ncbi:MAG TPA: hypothetical protein VFF40_00710 [Acidimicrobiia bacterium]|nr:hypothetical protein [Acidimicrobiia bacterium]